MGMDGLADSPRPGSPMKFSPVERLQMIATACEPGPSIEGLNGWTLDLLCERLKKKDIDVGRSQLHRILQRAELRPHKQQMWLHSPDSRFREKCNDIVGVYLHPPEGATVLCLDEMTGIQALERKHPDKPSTPAGHALPTTAAALADTTCNSMAAPGAVGGSSQPEGGDAARTPATMANDTNPARDDRIPTAPVPSVPQSSEAYVEPETSDDVTVPPVAVTPADVPSSATATTTESSAECTSAETSARRRTSRKKKHGCHRYSCCCGRVGRAGKREFEYIRHGTLSLIAAFNVLTGGVLWQLGRTRRGDDLEAFMESLASEITGTIHIIWDNLNIHHGDRWRKFNERHGNRFIFHYTPLHASWVNQVEIWFGILQRRCIKNGSFTGIDDLRRQVEAFITLWNAKDKHPFRWSFAGFVDPPS